MPAGQHRGPPNALSRAVRGGLRGSSDVLVSGRRRPLAEDRVEHIVRTVLGGENQDAQISITFLGRDAMRRLNAQYLGMHRPTDVVAFRLPEPDGRLVGDVYVCPWVAEREARSRGISLEEELTRLIIHGALHVLGYDHPAGSERTASPMWERQERYVRSLT
ncbi:MAG: rRNA maturation RNase YbeY [Gemmatimonadales bacterium]|nr:rRNA maturation RNase YbeY [Gemmatimonadales bacterium]